MRDTIKFRIKILESDSTEELEKQYAEWIDKMPDSKNVIETQYSAATGKYTLLIRYYFTSVSAREKRPAKDMVGII